ncbi:MAG: heme ABC exporter ATP-binding protein CcmA [Hyphomicrobiaceae bacterium]|nr:heme ABC exporter ATP-binding protein CcmA [Hyphomicrobiaceae bacterium]
MHLRALELAVDRGGRPVLDAVSFQVSRGEALLLTGPNGAGKTTLLRAIAGFLAPRAGSLALTDAAGAPLDVADHVHYVGHQNAIKGIMSVAENLDFWGGFLAPAGASDRAARLEAAMDRLALSSLADIPAAYLSAGQKRRLGLARLLVADRALWLLDEPTVSLDAASTAVVAGLVGEHLEAGGMVLAATHIPLGLAAARELRLAPRTAIRPDEVAL